MLTPRSAKKGAACDLSRMDSKATTYCSALDSDEDATLNEMMGKFDESYHYEKETDILRYGGGVFFLSVDCFLA